MRIFTFNPADYRGNFADQGYVHIKNGIDPEFLQAAREFSLRNPLTPVCGAADFVAQLAVICPNLVDQTQVLYGRSGTSRRSFVGVGVHRDDLPALSG